MIAYFYGVHPSRSSGHHPFGTGYERWPREPRSPWGSAKDALCEGVALEAAWGPCHSRFGSEQPEGAPAFVRSDGWTLVSLWDRSADQRYGSHATFALHADLSDAEALGAARHAFPEVFARIEAHLGREVAP